MEWQESFTLKTAVYEQAQSGTFDYFIIFVKKLCKDACQIPTCENLENVFSRIIYERF
jgi:hypothetical protein